MVKFIRVVIDLVLGAWTGIYRTFDRWRTPSPAVSFRTNPGSATGRVIADGCTGQSYAGAGNPSRERSAGGLRTEHVGA